MCFTIFKSQLATIESSQNLEYNNYALEKSEA